MSRPPPSAAAPRPPTSRRPRDSSVKPDLRSGAGVSAAIVSGHDLEVLVTRATVAVLVLDAGIRECTCPSSYGRSCSRAHRAISSGSRSGRPSQSFSASIALVQEPLIVALELVVQDDATDSAALLAQALLGALVGAIDLGVVGQLARLSEAGVERLAGLVKRSSRSYRFASSRSRPRSVSDDRSIVCAERRGPNQPFLFEMSRFCVSSESHRGRREGHSRRRREMRRPSPASGSPSR